MVISAGGEVVARWERPRGLKPWAGTHRSGCGGCAATKPHPHAGTRRGLQRKLSATYSSVLLPTAHCPLMDNRR